MRVAKSGTSCLLWPSLEKHEAAQSKAATLGQKTMDQGLGPDHTGVNRL